MASVNKFNDNGAERARLTDTSFGRRVQYLVNIDKHSAKQWINAHGCVMRSLSPAERKRLSNKQIRKLAIGWLEAPKGARAQAKSAGLAAAPEAVLELGIAAVMNKYMQDYQKSGANSKSAIENAGRHARILGEFLEHIEVFEYSGLNRENIALYAEWRNANRRDRKNKIVSAETINKELNRLAAIIKYGVKYHGWQERYLLDGIRVKATPQNTNAVRPFEIAEIKKIFAWLREYSERTGGWHLHDMILLALCAGLEAKALSLLDKNWFKLDLGLLRVYDKLVSGVLNAKTQKRARDVSLTPTLRKLCERGHIFARPARPNKLPAKRVADFDEWARKALDRAERETGISDINLHRFRHTCATARLSAGWQLIRVSRMLGHSNVNTTASHYAEYDLSTSGEGFEGMLKVYGEFVKWLDEGYFLMG